MQVDPNRARSKLQTMTNTALINLAKTHGVSVEENGRVLSKKRKISVLMQCDEIVSELGRKID